MNQFMIQFNKGLGWYPSKGGDEIQTLTVAKAKFKEMRAKNPDASYRIIQYDVIECHDSKLSDAQKDAWRLQKVGERIFSRIVTVR